MPTIDFDGFLYDFILRDDGVLLPNQNGSGGDAESIDHFTFRRSSDARIDLWELSACGRTLWVRPWSSTQTAWRI